MGITEKISVSVLKEHRISHRKGNSTKNISMNRPAENNKFETSFFLFICQPTFSEFLLYTCRYITTNTIIRSIEITDTAEPTPIWKSLKDLE